MSELILASGSKHRAKLLAGAGLDFRVIPADVDERAVEAPLHEADLSAEDIAEVLATTKAEQISQKVPSAFVIGCDQTLSIDGEMLHKPANMDEAHRRLLQLSGRSHNLNSAVVLTRDGQVIWSHVSVATLTMRELDPGFVGRHTSLVGEAVLSSVGAYQIEGPGIQLFEKIEGDIFTIIGLPLLPLLCELRRHGAIDA